MKVKKKMNPALLSISIELHKSAVKSAVSAQLSTLSITVRLQAESG